MVTTTVEKLSPTRVKLSIAVTPEELKPSIDHAYEHIAQSVNIPGFRKGKVPAPLIDQRVGREEVLNHAVSDGLDNLRSRFGTLITVDRPAKKGDFVQLDLVAKIGDTEVDTANGISYELGSGELIDGIDEAVDTLTAGETTTFESVLLGGDSEGQTAQITVTVNAVKERELPEADDDFAQISSQFDTIKELKADLKEQLAKSKAFGQGAQARDQIVDELVKLVEIPVPAKLVEDEVHRHLENENRLDDDTHRAEVTESSEKTFRSQILLDSIVEKEEIKVSQNELTQYLIQASAQYGMEHGEFIQVLDKNGQIPGMIGEVARAKALAVILGKAKVVDSKGKAVDVSEFAAAFSNDDEDDTDAAEFFAAREAEGGHDHDAKDSHGRKQGHEHYGHDHK